MIMNCTYTIQEHLLEIAVCSLIMLIDYARGLTNADILGQGNLNLVSEKSGKSQGILLSIICGNPADVSLIADPGVPSSIPSRSHTFVEIDHEIFSTVILLPSAESFKKGCCQLQAKVCAQSTG